MAIAGLCQCGCGVRTKKKNERGEHDAHVKRRLTGIAKQKHYNRVRSRHPAVVQADENAVATRTAVQAETWLVDLRADVVMQCGGKAQSYQWLATAVRMTTSDRFPDIIARFSGTIERWDALLRALACFSAKMEGITLLVPFLAAGVGDNTAFKEADLRLIHLFMPANNYVDALLV